MDKLSKNENIFLTQKIFIEKYKTPVLSCSLRLPEYFSNSPESKALFILAQELIKSIISNKNIKASTIFKNRFIIAVDEEIKKLKEKAIQLENNLETGIFFDFDVISLKMEKLSRVDLGYPLRPCIICGEPAKHCIRTLSHPKEDIIKAFNTALENYFLNYTINREAMAVAEKAVAAALLEVCIFPKPGLVSCNNPGSHKDMDLGTFILSSTTLTEIFACFFCAGNKEKDPKKLFNQIRAIGNCGERKMYLTTNGINTQKGLIFIMGVILSTLGVLGINASKKIIMNYINKMCKDLISDDFKNIDKVNRGLTVGEKAFVDYKIKGIRGEAERGFPSIFEIGLPVILEGISQGLSLNDSAIQGLLYIMSQLEDTNLMKNKNMESVEFVQKKTQEILIKGGMYKEESREMFEDFNREACYLNISPGGAADILTACLFFVLLRDKFPRLLFR